MKNNPSDKIESISNDRPGQTVDPGVDAPNPTEKDIRRILGERDYRLWLRVKWLPKAFLRLFLSYGMKSKLRKLKLL